MIRRSNVTNLAKQAAVPNHNPGVVMNQKIAYKICAL
jgi:hypothetical protein